MPRYIDAEEVERILRRYGTETGSNYRRHSGAVDLVAEEISFLPTADVAPVVHGKWKAQGLASGAFYICENCNHIAASKYPYCPNCGAKMDL